MKTLSLIKTLYHKFLALGRALMPLIFLISAGGPVRAAAQDDALLEALRRGGYVIYLRHPAVEQSQTDAEPPDLNNCVNQRNLSEEGRVTARALGRAFQTLEIPVDRVLAGALCRTRETALLIFGRLEISTLLTGFPADQREERIADLRQLLSSAPVPGVNTILIGDEPNLAHAAGVSIQEGEAAVFQPHENGQFSLAGRILPEEWQALEETAAGQAERGLLLPDLQTLPPANLLMRVNPVSGKKLIRFTNSIQNNGPGVMELSGYSDPLLGKTFVFQKIYSANGLSNNLAVGEFIFHPEHDHWHFGDFARYEILSLHPNGAAKAVLTTADKVSYCLRDDSRSPLANAARWQTYLGCNQERQGISTGWIDTYYYYLPGQDIDVSSLPDGLYALHSQVNPDLLLREGSLANNSAYVYFKISGDYLTRVDPASLQRGKPAARSE